MKLAKAVKYNLSVTGRAMVIFYIAIAVVYTFLAILFSALSDFQGNASMEVAAMVFLFSIGVVSYSEGFKMFLQNGISRKTMFFSVTATLFLCSAFMALLETLIGFVLSETGLIMPLTRLIYAERIAGLPVPQSLLEIFLLNLALYLFMSVLGYFIGIVFSKLSRLFRIIVPVGLSILLIAVPVLDLSLTNGKVLSAIGNFFVFIAGFQNGGNINYLTVACLCFTVFVLVITWPLLRRATVNEIK